MPRSPKPPGTNIPDTSWRSSSAFSSFKSSDGIHLIVTLLLCASPPCLRASTTLIYASCREVYLPTRATVRFLRVWTIVCHSSMSGVLQSNFKHLQATSARCSFSIAKGASYRVSTSKFCITWSVGTLQNSAILSLMPGSRGRSVRHTMMSGWIPIPCSSLTLACVGLVFISPEAPRYGMSVTWIKIAFSRPTSCWNWRIDSKKGWLSISPTVPPTSMIAICVSLQPSLR